MEEISLSPFGTNRPVIAKAFADAGAGEAEAERAVRNLEPYAANFRRMLLSRRSIPAATSMWHVLRILGWTAELSEEFPDQDRRCRRWLGEGLVPDPSGGAKSRRGEGGAALAECERLIGELCFAALYASDRANDEIFDGEEPQDIQLRELCAAVWREWQNATPAATDHKFNRFGRRAGSDATLSAMIDVLTGVLSSVGLDIDKGTVHDLALFSIDRVKPDPTG
jgi:hypothetical protein